ncbi:hypothetical protein [Hyalangium rubrum]|uniref:Uncharacterized protein n=1 Tax=Hyalangium rubrum TaxID=3103134 RepID=A0ABU5HHV2_9BACT|nr:hypothetical protein [Hyalangium sp. s54d21]MDY7233029.1 hypothetical protein [Hyalangium sp. s54d21]
MSPDPSSPPVSRVLRKDELELRASSEELEVHIWDYHAAPVHLSLEELEELGLMATPEREESAVSQVAPWRRAMREGRRDMTTPRLSEEASARALHVGGVAWLPVAEGLDVYVVSYHTGPVRLGLAHLARLGLRYRNA